MVLGFLSGLGGFFVLGGYSCVIYSSIGYKLQNLASLRLLLVDIYDFIPLLL